MGRSGVLGRETVTSRKWSPPAASGLLIANQAPSAVIASRFTDYVRDGWKKPPPVTPAKAGVQEDSESARNGSFSRGFLGRRPSEGFRARKPGLGPRINPVKPRDCFRPTRYGRAFAMTDGSKLSPLARVLNWGPPAPQQVGAKAKSRSSAATIPLRPSKGTSSPDHG